MSRVVVVSTGGTIAMRPDPSTGKLVPAVSGEELVEMLAWPEAPPLELDDSHGYRASTSTGSSPSHSPFG